MEKERKPPEMVTVFAELSGETALAFKLADGIKNEWVPKSQVNSPEAGVYVMPLWLAAKKGFV